MRDQNSISIAKELTGITPELVCDPVILYGYEKEIDSSKQMHHKPYMVVYSYDGKFEDSANEIMAYAKKRIFKLYLPVFIRSGLILM